MSSDSQLRIAVLPGDGIGVEVMDACLPVVENVMRALNRPLPAWNRLSGGAGAYRDTGVALTDEAMRECEQADAILFGAMGLPEVRYPDGTEIAPQLDIRMALDLFAGVRPIRAIPGIPGPLADPRAAQIDFVILREQSEGLYWSRGRGTMPDADTAIDTMRITRSGSARVFDYAFGLAAQRRKRGRPGRVTCVDKSGVLRAFAFSHGIFLERAKAHPGFASDTANIDAMALNLVRQPWVYDVMVTENMFGDILSDLAAGLIGGMGFAPSGDIGERHGMFQPCHGTAPDITGTGKANPTAMLLSAAMMLEWLGVRHADERLLQAASAIEDAVQSVFVDGRLRPAELGGSATTRGIATSVSERAVAKLVQARA
jgi:3-isopropylmalate dehydrogenase